MTIDQRLNGGLLDDLDETRSIKSEFDYSTKKKFLDIISQQKIQKYKVPTQADLGTTAGKEDERATLFSKRTGLSMRSGRNMGVLVGKFDSTGTTNKVDTILEQNGEENGQDQLVFHKCVECSQQLGEDEVTIN